MRRSPGKSRRKGSQAKGTAGAKALRQEWACIFEALTGS